MHFCKNWLTVKTILFSLVLTFCYSKASIAATHYQYIIIIDAGSSSSRAHLYAYTDSLSMNPIPVIKEVSTKSTKPALSAFASNPSSAGDSLKPVLDDAANALLQNGISPANVPVWVYGTAGMRLLTPSQQNAIYKNVTSYIKSHYSFQVQDKNIKTITGVMEGVYDWLEVNYLSNAFADFKTVGSIDMGGASTQIAFATTDTSHPDNEVTIRINNKAYTIFSQSFLGLGQDQAQAAMTSDPSAASCFPAGYAFSSGTGNFNFSACGAIYANIIQKNRAAQKILSTEGQEFIAFSGIYYNYSFFNSLSNPAQAVFQSQIQNICNRSWAQLQAQYGSSDRFLSSYCANGTYFNELLYNTYHLQASQLTVLNEINGQGIDWTVGALLYSLVSQESSALRP